MEQLKLRAVFRTRTADKENCLVGWLGGKKQMISGGKLDQFLTKTVCSNGGTSEINTSCAFTVTILSCSHLKFSH